MAPSGRALLLAMLLALAARRAGATSFAATATTYASTPVFATTYAATPSPCSPYDVRMQPPALNRAQL